jgi:hypothetical protein
MNRFAAVAAGIVAEQVNSIAAIRKLADIAGGFVSPTVTLNHPFATVLFDKTGGFVGGTEGVRGNTVHAVRGKHLLGMFTVVFQQITARTSADYRKTLRAQVVRKFSEAVVIADDQVVFTDPIEPAFDIGAFLNHAIQNPDTGRITDMRPDVMAFLRQPGAQTGTRKILRQK